jgi:hypothetical protein
VSALDRPVRVPVDARAPGSPAYRDVRPSNVLAALDDEQREALAVLIPQWVGADGELIKALKDIRSVTGTSTEAWHIANDVLGRMAPVVRARDQLAHRALTERDEARAALRSITQCYPDDATTASVMRSIAARAVAMTCPPLGEDVSCGEPAALASRLERISPDTKEEE